MKCLLFCINILLFLSVSAMDKGNCECSSKEAVSKTNKIAKRRLGNVKNLISDVREDSMNYIISYTDKQVFKDSSMRGGRMYVIVSKKTCKIIDTKILK